MLAFSNNCRHLITAESTSSSEGSTTCGNSQGGDRGRSASAEQVCGLGTRLFVRVLTTNGHTLHPLRNQDSLITMRCWQLDHTITQHKENHRVAHPPHNQGLRGGVGCRPDEARRRDRAPHVCASHAHLRRVHVFRQLYNRFTAYIHHKR